MNIAHLQYSLRCNFGANFALMDRIWYNNVLSDEPLIGNYELRRSRSFIIKQRASSMDLWEDGTFEVYLVQREGAQKECAEHWQIAIGSQDVVHLKKRDIYWMWRIYMRVVN